MRILVIEDDAGIAEGIAVALKRAGYQPDIAMDGAEGEERAMIHSYGAILLDLMLPGTDGRTICKNLRELNIATPILMITARDHVSDRVLGLDAGADDYLVKPFAIEELLARIRALTRREANRRSNELRVGGLSINTLTHEVQLDGESISLTQREFALLEALARNEGRVLTREMILERVFNSDDALPNTVNFHMSSLRKKVDPESKHIHTVHGVGYVLRRESS